MAKIAYYNALLHTVHLGGKAIGAGQTREVDDRDLPSASAPIAPPAPATDPLRELLERPVMEISKRLPEILSDDLARLRVAEAASKSPRKSLLAAIATEELVRAKANAEGEAAGQEAGTE